MSIRTRLTVSFALLAAFSVLAAAIVGYTSTSTRVRSEIDLTLRESVSRAIGPGPNGRACRALSRPEQPEVGARAGQRRQRLDFSDARAQCIDADGVLLLDARLRLNPDRRLPIDARDRSIARLRIDEDPLPLDSSDAVPGATGDIRRARADTRRDVRIRTNIANDETLRIATGPIAGGGAFMVARDLDESSRVLDALRDRFALIGLLVTSVAAALGAFVARAFARPVRALTDATGSLAANGGLDETTMIAPEIASRSDELGHLAQSFSTMIATLRSSRAQQRQLAQDAGHELRTPLTTLRTDVEVLRKYPDLALEKRVAILQEMDDELHELANLTDELLVLATDATPDDPVVDLDLADLARSSIDRFERRTGRHVDARLEGSSLSGRRIQLSRAIDNLLANSAKFDRSNSAIVVSVASGVVTVRDHGPGFDDADLPRVFDRFFRAATARTLPGTGLGLAIVADAATAHGGTVTASNHPDGGAVVTLTVVGGL